uniref:Uncharacterized protein n=1 Tax=Arundo donax TaxID=35708 RepID=A0A0A9DDY1_ARUDO
MPSFAASNWQLELMPLPSNAGNEFRIVSIISDARVSHAFRILLSPAVSTRSSDNLLLLTDE